MIILVTGTPGTGKTTLAAHIGTFFNIPVFNVHEEAKRLGFVSEKDVQRNADIINEDFVELIAVTLSKENESYVFEGLLSHYATPSREKICVVLKCDISELNRRLRLRKYDDVKVRENIDSEIFKVIEIEAEELGHRVLVYDNTSKDDVNEKKLFLSIKKFQDNISSK